MRSLATNVSFGISVHRFGVLLAFALPLAVGVGTSFAQSAGVAPRSFSAQRWQLDFEFHDPRRITIQGVGDKTPKTYWYVLYRVTNNTGSDVQFFPSFKLVTDNLQVVEAGDGVGMQVYERIGRRHENDFGFFAMPTKVSGLLLQGAENARFSAAVFQTFDPDSDGFTLYVGGLSGVVERIPNPGFDDSRDESDDNPRFFVLRQTLAVRYDLPGDLSSRMAANPIRRDRDWVMR